MTANDELYLIDGSSLAYRAFFALPDTISTQEGFPTNALYGLSAMMMKVLAEERPGRLVVAWDAPGPTFRHEAYSDDTAGRSKPPALLKEQSPPFRPLMHGNWSMPYWMRHKKNSFAPPRLSETAGWRRHWPK